MNKQQFNKTIETVINSPRSDLQKINVLQNAFALYVKEETDRIVAELEEISEIHCKEYHKEEGSLYLQDAIKIVRKGGAE